MRPSDMKICLATTLENNLLMDAEAHDLLAGLIDLWGEAKATTFLRQIAQDQKVTFSRQSHTFMTQFVATGEHDVIVDGYVHNAVALKEKGAPIDYVVMNPTIVRPPSIIAILARAPHPYASAFIPGFPCLKEAMRDHGEARAAGRRAKMCRGLWNRRAICTLFQRCSGGRT